MMYTINTPKTSGKFIKITHKVAGFFDHAYKMAFMAIIVFFALFTLCGVFGFLPHSLQASLQPHYVALKGTSSESSLSTGPGTAITGLASANVSAAQSDPTNTSESAPLVYTPQGQKELPLKIVFPSLKKETQVYNPVSSAISVLDTYLDRGATRYPGSASLDEKGNVFIFGHSARTSALRNPAFNAFTGIEKLAHGEEIYVYGPSTVYVYRVRNVVQVKSTEAAVNLNEKDRMLTLSTCDLLGAKEDRFLLTADFIRSYPKGAISLAK